MIRILFGMITGAAAVLILEPFADVDPVEPMRSRVPAAVVRTLDLAAGAISRIPQAASTPAAAPAAEVVRVDESADSTPGPESETPIHAYTPSHRSYVEPDAAAEHGPATLAGDAVADSEFRTAEPASAAAGEFRAAAPPERSASSSELVRRLLALHARIGNTQ